jgi:hypothetical protein
MAQLGEVLGGMLTDVVRARMAADLVTAQAVETYRADPALASMSVPRVTVSTLTVKLNFSVNTVQTGTPVPTDVDRARADWTSRLQDRVVRDLPVLRNPPAGETPPIREVPVVSAHLDSGLTGDVEPLVTATMSHLMEGRGRIPKVARDELSEQVREQALAFVDSLRQQHFADLAIRSTMDVEVVSDKVSQTPAESLQSLEVTFSVDDLEEVLTLPTEWR